MMPKTEEVTPEGEEVIELFRDRIVGLRKVQADELERHPGNWRRHPLAQRDALQATIAKVGLVDAVIAREGENGDLHLIDGHLRADLAGDQEVSVIVTDLDEDEANLVLATLDPIAAMAEADSEQLAELLTQVAIPSTDLLHQLEDTVRASQPWQTYAEEVESLPVVSESDTKILKVSCGNDVSGDVYAAVTQAVANIEGVEVQWA